MCVSVHFSYSVSISQFFFIPSISVFFASQDFSQFSPCYAVSQYISVLGEFICPVLSSPFSLWSPFVFLFLLSSLMLSSFLVSSQHWGLNCWQDMPCLIYFALAFVINDCEQNQYVFFPFVGQLQCIYSVH